MGMEGPVSWESFVAGSLREGHRTMTTFCSVRFSREERTLSLFFLRKAHVCVCEREIEGIISIGDLVEREGKMDH